MSSASEVNPLPRSGLAAVERWARRATDALSEPAAPAHAVLNMQALSHNLAQVRRRAPDSKLMAVIKANAYGHGMVRVARALGEADAFAVARVDEGIALREAGIRQRIAVLQGFLGQDELDLHARFNLEPVVHNPEQAEWLEQADLTRSISAWLKLDSGMHRLGLNAEEFSAVHLRLRTCRVVRQPVSLMTHLANADVLNDPVTVEQLAVFRQTAGEFRGERSLANSAGIFAWEASHADWVRPGLALYGASPFADRSGPDLGLKPVMTFRSRLIAIKSLKPGEAVGYGGDWVCQRPTRMGVAAVGYGDGYPRHAPSGTPVLIGERRVPLIGRVSMDMISVDLTDAPEAAVGDPVTLWGEGLPVEVIAAHAQTIPYVLLCNVTPRVKLVEC